MQTLAGSGQTEELFEGLDRNGVRLLVLEESTESLIHIRCQLTALLKQAEQTVEQEHVDLADRKN